MKRGHKAQPLILAVLSLFFHLGNLSLGQNPIAVLAEEPAEPDPITFNYPGPFQSGYWHDSTRYPSELPFIVYADGYRPTDFTFSTSDPEIAYIYAPQNVGLQIGDPGFATITATLNSDPSKSYSVEIEVYDSTFIQDGSYHWDDCFYAYDTGYITFDVTSNTDRNDIRTASMSIVACSVIPST